MKKFFALLLALVMVLSLVACGDKKTDDNQDANNTDDQQGGTTTYTNPDDIDDNMTSEDGKYEVAFVTDVGQLKDKSFNQGTFDGVKLYAANNGLSYKYYQPANGDQATDDDRYDAMKAAVDGGAKVVVCAGFMQETALKKAAAEFTDTKFVFIDGWSLGLDNVAGIAFNEEQCGYFAGYAVVKEGYEKLGFTGGGGGTNPACIRYGWGFAQGANDAAKEMDKTVDLNYSWEYGASFQASPELQTMVSGWYSNGTEIVFACGGSMFQSVVAAASASARVAVFAGVEYDALHPFKPFYYALYAVVVPGTALDVIEAETEINAQRVAAVKVYPIVGTDYVVLGLAHFGSVGTEYGALMHERQKRFVSLRPLRIRFYGVRRIRIFIS